MITDGIIKALFFIVKILVSPILLLDDVVIPDGFYLAIEKVTGSLSSLNSFFPIDTVLTILAIAVGIEIAYLLFKLIMWVIKRFPTQS